MLISVDLICFKSIQVDTTKWIISDFVVLNSSILTALFKPLSFFLASFTTSNHVKQLRGSEQTKQSEFSNLNITNQEQQQLSSCLDLAKRIARSKIAIKTLQHSPARVQWDFLPRIGIHNVKYIRKNVPNFEACDPTPTPPTTLYI